MLNLAVTHDGKLLCPNLTDREPPDRKHSVVGHTNECTSNSGIHKVILSDFRELPSNFDFMKIISSLVAYMIESSGMAITRIEYGNFDSSDRVLTMCTQMPFHHTMLEIRIPPDKCTVLNIAVTYHGEERQYILPDKEPQDRFKILNTTEFGIHLNYNTYGCHKFLRF